MFERQRAGWSALGQADRDRIIDDLKMHLKKNVESQGIDNLEPRSRKSVVPGDAQIDSKYNRNQAY